MPGENPQTPPRRRVGFRLSVADSVILVTGATATYLLFEPARLIAVMVALVVGHFFLFCNVFRVRRKLELWWGALLVVNVVAWRLVSDPTATRILMTQVPVTLFVLGLTLRSRDYHGVLWRRINPEWPHAEAADPR